MARTRSGPPQHEAIGDLRKPRMRSGAAPTVLILRKPQSGCLEGPPTIWRSLPAPHRSRCFEMARTRSGPPQHEGLGGLRKPRMRSGAAPTVLILRKPQSGCLEGQPTVWRSLPDSHRSRCFEMARTRSGPPQHEGIGGLRKPRMRSGAAPTVLILRKPQSGCLEGRPTVWRSLPLPTVDGASRRPGPSPGLLSMRDLVGSARVWSRGAPCRFATRGLYARAYFAVRSFSA
jgi:hypothetical protein